MFHDQSKDIYEQIAHLRKHVSEQGFEKSHAIHSAPLIRREKDYEYLDLTSRRKLFRSLFTFMRLCDVRYKSFLFHKAVFQNDHDKMVSNISRALSLFVRENLEFFQSFDELIVYYDNGQKEITNIINIVFNSFLDADVRKVSPSDYSLFQAADLFCTLTFLQEKCDTGTLSNSEIEFFLNSRRLKKHYLKPILDMRL